jgi:hypothetical protein
MQQPSDHAVTRMLRRARILPALLALALIATTLPVAAHTNNPDDWHAPALAEGGSTLFRHNPIGIDPEQDFWLDNHTFLKHRQDCSAPGPCRNFYRAGFLMNSWRGTFVDDNTVGGGPGAQPQYIQYYIRIGLWARDTTTNLLTPLSSSIDSFTSSGNFSYGCTGNGREIEVSAQPGKDVLAQIWVWGIRKYYYNGNWYNGPSSSQYWHTTRSRSLSSVVFADNHTVVEDPLADYWIRPTDQTNIPNAVHRGTCPPGTVMT